MLGFEEFYDEWNEGRLNREICDYLHHMANTMLRLDQMGYIDESTIVSPDSGSQVPEDAMIEDRSLDKKLSSSLIS